MNRAARLVRLVRVARVVVHLGSQECVCMFVIIMCHTELARPDPNAARGALP